MYITVMHSGKDKKNAYVKLVEAYRQDGVKKTRVIKTLGRLDELTKKDPHFLERIKAQYSKQRQAKKKATVEARLESAKRVLAISNKATDESDLAPAPLLHYGHYPLWQIWDEDLALTRKMNYLQKASGTRVKFNFNDIARHMACLKVMDPSSVLFSYGHKDDFIGDPLRDASLDNCYETLSFLKENKDKIFRWINKKMDAKFGVNRATMVFYDVTNVYFETPLTDAEKDYAQADFGERIQEAANRMKEDGLLTDDCFDEDGYVIPENLPSTFWAQDDSAKLQYLRMRGPSKEHRTDLPLVSVALVIDQNGLPMDFEAYAGNASEFKTMQPSIRKLKEKYHIENAVVVADRGLNSVANLKMLQDLDLGFLVAQKVTNLGAEITKQMFDLSGYSSFDPENPEKGKYRIIPNWKKAGLNGETVDCMLVLTYNEKRKRRDNKILDIMVDIVNKKAAAGAKIGPGKSGWASIALTDKKPDCAVIGVDEKALEKKRRYSGFAAMVYEDSPSTKKSLNPVTQETDDKETESAEKKRMLSGREVAAQYPRLNRIEDSFRVMKSHLGLRPMYVRNSDHIRGHITVCCLSLLMIRLVQERLRKNQLCLSIPEICTTLSGACVATLKIGENIMFCHVGHHANVRKGRESLNTQEIVMLLRDGKIKASHIPDLMKACDLVPLGRLNTLQELGGSLRKRFLTPQDAIPALRLETL